MNSISSERDSSFGAEVEQLLDASRQEGGGQWRLAVHDHPGIRFESFPDENDARAAFTNAAASRVLFRPGGVPEECYTVPHDPEGVGVALIWHFRTTGGFSFGDLSVVEAIRAGAAVFVPPRRPRSVQVAMKSVVNALFGRTTVAHFACGPHRSAVYCYDVASYPRVAGKVALSIDDAPCVFSSRESSMMQDVLRQLRSHRAKASFFLVGRSVEGHEEDLVEVLREGHEIQNHGWVDRPYHMDSIEDFGRAVDACSDKIRELQRRAGVAEGVQWFRAPQAKFTEEMEQAVRQRGLRNVMCDTYACCPIIEDGAFIGEHLARAAQEGSILLLHMPSRGVRSWCYEGLECLLDGLRDRGVQVVSISELEAHASGSASQPRVLQWSLAHRDGAWSSLMPAEELAREIDVQEPGAIRIRAAGETQSQVFRDVRAAVRWLRGGPVQATEHPETPAPEALAALVDEAIAELPRLLQEAVSSGKEDFKQDLDAAALILGDREKLGSDWQGIVEGATDATVAAAFALNVEPTSWKPVFTSRGKAESFVTAVQAWNFRHVQGAIATRVEREVRGWLSEKGTGAFPLDCRPLAAAGAVELPPPRLPGGEQHGLARQAAGALGTLLTVGQWGGAWDWAAGDEEFWIGKELSTEYFSRLAQETLEVAVRAAERTWARAPEALLRAALGRRT